MNLEQHAGRWRGRTVVCIASGPSRTAADCEMVREAGHPTIVVNLSYRDALFADILFAMDAYFWREFMPEIDRSGFKGERWGYVRYPGVIATKGALYPVGWGHSGSYAISLAIVAKPAKVVLIGYDSQYGPKGEKHCHEDYPADMGNASSIKRWPYQSELVAKYARQHGVNIVNCSRATALTCFERGELEAEL